MLFAFSKIMIALILPPASLIILLALGLLVMRKYHRAGVSILWIGLVLLYALSTQPVADGLMNRLEREYPPFKQGKVRPEAIVVLAGGAKDLSWAGLGITQAETSLARTVAAVAFYRVSGGVTMVMAGGSGDPTQPKISEAKAMSIPLSVSASERTISWSKTRQGTRWRAPRTWPISSGRSGSCW